MDLVSSIRKSGSRGGVNFSWDEVANSAHRENYLGHSLKAPVGRWQQGRDLEWYAKNKDADDGPSDETPEERAARERREEIKRVKEAEEDALARALGLPVKQRDQTGANAVEIGKSRIGPQDAPSATKTQKDGIEGDIEVTVVIGTRDLIGHREEGTTGVADTGDTTMTVDERSMGAEGHTVEIAATKNHIIAQEESDLGARGLRVLEARNGVDHTRRIDDAAVALTIEGAGGARRHDS
ncbi:hypothetical protein E8E14_007477 [Neopestalotiopsis sp. 37M]|nr:hypothetical protein E8E14_007477 [Neopestalotiopsis sp. 37M]